MSQLLGLRVEGYRSLRETSLSFCPSGVTALVGPNDSGKSSILKALAMFFNPDNRLGPDDASRDYKGEAFVEATVETKEELNIGGSLIPAGQYLIRRKLSEDKYHLRAIPGARKGVDLPSRTRENLARVVPAFYSVSADLFPHAVSRRESSGTPATQILADRFRFTSPLGAMQQLEIEEETLLKVSDLLKEVWKSSPRERFRYAAVGDHVSYSVTAHGERYFPLANMGAGLQRAFSMALQVEHVRLASSEMNIVFLLDEPEASLHPRAQRDFLRFLHGIPETQFVYATHSAAMVDISRPETIRTVLYDEHKKTTVVFDRKHLHDNFHTMKLALGILPADALSYGYVNIVVEGAIDLLVYPMWAQILDPDGEKFDLALLKFINGSGSSVPTYFDVALSSGVPTVALLDDDQGGRTLANRIREHIQQNGYKLDYEPIYFLKQGDGNTDLESVLPEDRLVAAVNQYFKPNSPLAVSDLSANPAVSRGKNIEHFLSRQAMKFDEQKTAVAVAVAKSMTIEEIPSCVGSFFTEVRRLLDRQEALVTRSG